MTTPNIPPEALDGRECLVFCGKQPYLGKRSDYKGCWSLENRGLIDHSEITAAIPLSWCLAAPGMREAMAKWIDFMDRPSSVPDGTMEQEIAWVRGFRSALAACEKGAGDAH